MPRARSVAKRPMPSGCCGRLLRDRRRAGAKFRRQVPIGPFVAGFACVSHRMVIELDGGQHAESTADARRDAYLHAEGWRVLRFWNNDLLHNRNGVLWSIADGLGMRWDPH